MSQKILKKISVKTVCNKPKAFFKSLPEGETPLMRILGIARGYEVGTSTYGDFLKFKGEFHATNLETGEVSIGAVAFLPAPVDALLAEQINAGEKGAPVEFGFDIVVVPDDTEVGFQYRVKTLTETKVSDPLAALAARVGAPALAAPASAPASAQLPEPDPAPEQVSAKGGKKK